MQLLMGIVNPVESVYRASRKKPDLSRGAGGCRLGSAALGAVGISRARLGRGRMKRCFQTNELCRFLIFNPGVNKRLSAKSGFLLALHKAQPPVAFGRYLPSFSGSE